MALWTPKTMDKKEGFQIFNPEDMGETVKPLKMQGSHGRYYYHCDVLGMMIWQDQPSGTEKEGDCFKVPPWTRLEETAGRDAEAWNFVVFFWGGEFLTLYHMLHVWGYLYTYICHTCIW